MILVLVGRMPYDLGASDQDGDSHRKDSQNTQSVIDDYWYNAWTKDEDLVPTGKHP